MTEVVIRKASRPGKKLDAIFDGKKTVSFGQKGASDYTLHQNSQRKANYIARHQKNENWNANGIETPGFLSRWILWNKKSVEASVDDLNKRYKKYNFVLK
jgi:hypothetical protein